MGVTYAVTCVDCGEEAPEVGDFGYIGYPSLQEEKGPRFVPNFGFLYLGLVAVGLKTQSVEELRAFLAAHGGHAMDMSCDGESMFEEEDDGAGEDLDEDADLEDLEDLADEGGDGLGVEDDEVYDDKDAEGIGEDDGDDEEPVHKKKPMRVDPKAFVAAHYEVFCARCQKTFRSEWDERIMPFPSRKLAKTEIKEFLHRAYEEDAFGRGSEPFGPEDFAALGDFFRDHAAHSPEVRLSHK